MILRTNSDRQTAAIVTVSDSCARGLRQDLSGPALARALETAGFQPIVRIIVSDDRSAIEDALRRAAASADLVITTGGTGIAPRDVTPEATRAVCDRLLDGVPQLMRAAGLRETPLAALSRALCGTLGVSVILNVPGSPVGAVTSLEAALPVLPHAIDLLHGLTEHVPSHPLPPVKSASGKKATSSPKKVAAKSAAARPSSKAKPSRPPNGKVERP